MARARWAPGKIVHVDRDFDRDKASDGHSRYGAYVNDNRFHLLGEISGGQFSPEDPDLFAVSAWRIANPPYMDSPPLVAVRADLTMVSLNHVDGHVVVTVEFPVTHHSLAGRLPAEYADWEPFHPAVSPNGYTPLAEPVDTPGRPAVLATVKVRHIPDWTFLQNRAIGGVELVEEALASVQHTADIINTQVGPAVERVLEGGPR